METCGLSDVVRSPLTPERLEMRGTVSMTRSLCGPGGWGMVRWKGREEG